VYKFCISDVNVLLPFSIETPELFAVLMILLKSYFMELCVSEKDPSILTLFELLID